jgi:2-keto-4-pentenoate hydratase/2-oxohepta-3-ene-1,7-dioic acid hydratase in catechol pathway
MRLASFNIRGRTSFGAVVGDGLVDLKPRLSPRFQSLLDVFRAHALGEAAAAARGVRPDFPISEAEMLPPLLCPEKILCIGVNYRDRNLDYDDPNAPKYPSMFYRHPGSLVGHGQDLVRPKVSEQLDYEGVIAIVIGREGRHVPRENALEHVAAVTLCNEGCVRDWLRHGKFNVTQGKNFDCSGSIGPWVVTTDEIDLTKPLKLTVRVNGEVTQDDTTDSMIMSLDALIAYVTTFMTLKPGDIVVTGTPVKKGPRTDTPRWLVPGDVVELECPEIGVLRNAVVDEK